MFRSVTRTAMLTVGVPLLASPAGVCHARCECKVAHHLVRAVIDGDVSHGDFDGLVNSLGFGGGSGGWPDRAQSGYR